MYQFAKMCYVDDVLCTFIFMCSCRQSDFFLRKNAARVYCNFNLLLGKRIQIGVTALKVNGMLNSSVWTSNKINLFPLSVVCTVLRMEKFSIRVFVLFLI